jgi:hypothetical protein
VGKVERHRRLQVFQLLAESVGQARKTAPKKAKKSARRWTTISSLRSVLRPSMRHRSVWYARILSMKGDRPPHGYPHGYPHCDLYRSHRYLLALIDEF